MNIIMFGPPGAGKGSVSAMIKEKFNIPHISTGDIIRAEAQKPDNKVKPYMEKGELVPDTLVMELVKERLSQDDCKQGYILDGFPRTLAQAEFLDEQQINIEHVINFEVDEDKLIHRLSGRRMDPDTGAIYNVNTMTLPEGVDPQKLIQRPDDKEDVIKNRIEVYKKETAPVLDYYKERNLLRDIDGNPALEHVQSQVFGVLENSTD